MVSTTNPVLVDFSVQKIVDVRQWEHGYVTGYITRNALRGHFLLILIVVAGGNRSVYSLQDGISLMISTLIKI